MRPLKGTLIWVGLLIIVTVAIGGIVGKSSMADWRTASRESAGIAPDP